MKYQNIFVYSVLAIGLLSIPSLLDSIYGQTNATQQNQTAAQQGQNQTAAQQGQNQTAAQQGQNQTAAQQGQNQTAAQQGQNQTAAQQGQTLSPRSSSIRHIRYPRNKG